MPCFHAESFCALLDDPEGGQLAPHLAEVEGLNIDWTFRMVQELSRAVRNHSEPLRCINALLITSRLLHRPRYPLLLLLEVYLLPALAKPIRFLLEQREFEAQTTYFQRSGSPVHTPFLQNLSYNYLALTAHLLQMASTIKPARVHQGRETEEPSGFSRQGEKLARERVSLPLSGVGGRAEWERLREEYLSGLERWVLSEDSLVYYCMELLEGYLGSEEQEQSSLEGILQYGQASVTGETIARLIDLLPQHPSFEVRVRALRLFDKMILWGDVEALLVANFTEHVELVVKAIWGVEGERSIEEGRRIYPQVAGQEAKKLEFYRLFLSCLQKWAVAFPNHEFLILDPADAPTPAPLYQLYKLLREKKGLLFPHNPDLSKYEAEARLAFLEKLHRNKLILADINTDCEESEQSLPSMTLSELQQYYEHHKELLVGLISKKESIYGCMEQLGEFRRRFEGLVEGARVEEGREGECDGLIEGGLELGEVIGAVYAPYLQLLHHELSEKEFLERAASACIAFFSPPSSPSPPVHFYSEHLAHRKESLLQLLRQRSNPLERDLRHIANSLLTKQFRHNYRQKLERCSSGKTSEPSEMSLEIFTRTKFTRESREEMDLIQPCLARQQSGQEKELLKAKDNLAPSSLNSSREKKKLTVVSRERMERGNENEVLPLKVAKNDNSSQTRSSRQQGREGVGERVVSFQENSQYFSFIPNEAYKLSYLANNLLIFKTPFLTIQRTIAQQEHSRVAIRFLLTAHQPLPDFAIAIEEQECIRIDQRKAVLPRHLEGGRQYGVVLEGEMRKVPLRMPIVAFSIQRKIVFEYILPFTLNFFLAPLPPRPAPPAHALASPRLLLSRALLPHGVHCLPNYFPACRVEEQQQRALWEVRLGKMHFLFCFQLLEFNTITISGCDLARVDDYNESMLRYAISLFSHLLAEREA